MIQTGSFDEYKRNELEFIGVVYTTIMVDVVAAKAINVNPFFMALHALEMARLVIKTFPENVPDKVEMMAVFHARLSMIQDEINNHVEIK